MARVTVIDGNGKTRKLNEKLANDATFMAREGLTKQEVKAPAKKPAKKTTAKK